MRQTILILIISIAIVSCAKIIAPTGGKKDIIPPNPIKSIPLNNSVNFNKNKVEIIFDEFIVLKNVNQELIVSPPFAKKPIVKLKGKTIIVELKDTLKKDVTYTLNFYNSITDLNEGNVLKNYNFNFSTGEARDSLYIEGVVNEILSGQPCENTLVFIYLNPYDSIAKKQKPDYYGRTDKKGWFTIPNIKPGNYFIVALKDANSNLLFDLPNEPLAFTDSLVSPGFKQIELFDTLKIFDRVEKLDSIYRDSIVSHKIWQTTTTIHLNLFTEDFDKQYIKSYKRDERNVLKALFNKPLNSKPGIRIQGVDQGFIKEFSSRYDSVSLWLTDSILWKKDSLFTVWNYSFVNKDSQIFYKTDTLIFSYREPKMPKVDTLPLSLKLNLTKNIPFDLNQSLTFTTGTPIKYLKTADIEFWKIENDSVLKKIPLTIHSDSLNPRKYTFDYKFQEESKYRLYFPRRTFEGIYKKINDSLVYDINTKALSEYGKIIFSFGNPVKHKLFQILSGKDKVIKEFYVNEKSTLEIPYLKAGKYIVRVISDVNRNQKWDTGNYIQRKQPETITYYKEEIVVKANWDYELVWNLE